MDTIEILEALLQEIEQAKLDSVKPEMKRTGDYRIGLTIAENLVIAKISELKNETKKIH